MTPEEIRAASERVAQHYGVWTPGQLCEGCDGIGSQRRHEIPCPDLTTPEMFVRLLKESQFTVGYAEWEQMWVSGNAIEGQTFADSPEHALLKALDVLVRQEGEK